MSCTPHASLRGRVFRADVEPRAWTTVTPGRRAEVATSGTVSSFLPNAKLDAVKRDPQRIWNDRGIPGRGSRIYRFLVSGSGSVTLEYRSEKGGTISKQVRLRKR